MKQNEKVILFFFFVLKDKHVKNVNVCLGGKNV